MIKDLASQKLRAFSKEEDETWKVLYANLEGVRKNGAHPLFRQGLERLGFTSEHIPNLDHINQELVGLTGWRGVPVEGFEGPESFYPALARKEFPIGNFIRDRSDINYTPAPDIFHDLYGHMPFYADREYADACHDFSVRASRFVNDPARLRMFERFFWFTYEFAVIATPRGREIFGGGILSSLGECEYALGPDPEVLPFDIDVIIRQEFKIDEFQKRIFELKSAEQLYQSNGLVEEKIRNAKVD